MKIDEMEAGRELDALIHERIFGYKSLPFVDPPYSTDIGINWSVVEAMKAQGFILMVRTGKTGADAQFLRLGDWTNAPTLEEAICRAALMTLDKGAA